ncbi:hypothetical protein RW1_049_00060 [Rhodococcus wratislaviensis NBRC 100605]|uniref:Uncharacterized protein n=1 Tax=Rhodococcus wratislaviensis NBRC 100605 TaxID=1219028 RepID=X0RAS7_RHOWR|nr:hypothetical protein RW1_049_00060 [Rhodococcus wratislaviensis NBRC 100605]
MIGWAIEGTIRTDLVEAALPLTVTTCGELPDRAIFQPTMEPGSGLSWRRWLGDLPLCGRVLATQFLDRVRDSGRPSLVVNRIVWLTAG